MPLELLIYNGILFLLIVVFFPFFLFPAIFISKYREGLAGRLGFVSAAFKAKVCGKENIWIHSASAGEVKCVLELAEALKKKYPGSQIVFTTTGVNGQRMLKNAVKNAVTCYLPLDFHYFIKPLVNLIKPKILVAVETEYWPGLFYLSKRQGARVVLVNGRFSKKAVKRYRFISFLIKKTFFFVDLFAMRSSEDAATLLSLGAPGDKIVVTGDLKNEIPVVDLGKKAALEAVLTPVLKEQVLVLGSVHYREIPYFKDILKYTLEEKAALTVIIAPRFLEEAWAFVKMLEETGVPYIKRSSLKGGGNKTGVVILDTIGELSVVYSLASAAFVGGSFVDGIGGHNLLEPVYFGKPVFFGPYTPNFKEMADELELKLLGYKVIDASGLTMQVTAVLKDSALLKKIAEISEVFLESKKGSMIKTLDLI